MKEGVKFLLGHKIDLEIFKKTHNFHSNPDGAADLVKSVVAEYGCNGINYLDYLCEEIMDLGVITSTDRFKIEFCSAIRHNIESFNITHRAMMLDLALKEKAEKDIQIVKVEPIRGSNAGIVLDILARMPRNDMCPTLNCMLNTLNERDPKGLSELKEFCENTSYTGANETIYRIIQKKIYDFCKEHNRV